MAKATTKEDRYKIENGVAFYKSEHLYSNKGEYGILLEDFVDIQKLDVQFIETVLNEKKLRLDVSAVKGGTLVGYTYKPKQKGVRGGLKNVCEYLIVKWQEILDDTFEVN